jgi:O-methyltransferase
MIPEEIFIANLKLSNEFRNLPGCIVECGVWKGGMIASIAELLGRERNYYLFDSFEGLPEAKEIDGKAAIEWQSNTKSDWYFDNCSADKKFAITAMESALGKDTKKFNIYPGWFESTISDFKPSEPIALLRLDSDWYDSTLFCLNHLFPFVTNGGVIIIDDYYTWDGCSKAVHDYLSHNKCIERIREFDQKVAWIKKGS